MISLQCWLEVFFFFFTLDPGVLDFFFSRVHLCYLAHKKNASPSFYIVAFLYNIVYCTIS